jgi:hypothetical protein
MTINCQLGGCEKPVANHHLPDGFINDVCLKYICEDCLDSINKDWRELDRRIRNMSKLEYRIFLNLLEIGNTED